MRALFTGHSQSLMESGVLQCGMSGLCFRFFLAAATAATELDALPLHDSDEVFCVVGSVHADDLIAWLFGAHGLDFFLQLAFRIGFENAITECAQVVSEESFDKEECRRRTGVEVGRTDYGFQCVCEGGVAITSAICFFSASHAQMRTEFDASSMTRECFGRDELGACFGEYAFIGMRKFLVEQLGERELEDGVAQEFQALIVWLGALVFIANAAMSQSELKQCRVAKSVTEDGFQRVHE